MGFVGFFLGSLFVLIGLFFGRCYFRFLGERFSLFGLIWLS